MEQLHRQRFTGTLSLSKNDKKKKLWFSRGEIFKIQSNLLPELLGRMMVDRHWITEADLNTCLTLQRNLLSDDRPTKRLGELVQEIHGLDNDELKILLEQQSVGSYLQALTWKQGEYEIQQIAMPQDHVPIIAFQQVSSSVDHLLGSHNADLGQLFEILEAWDLDSKPSELSRVPLWSILASCRRLGCHGIISVRRQNKLYEIVLKYGIPLTLYEGTFGQPRQTIVVRQVSAEHETFFREQLLRLLSFLTGTVYFRNLSNQGLEDGSTSPYLQFRETKEETGVTRSVSPEEVPFELKEDFLKSQPHWNRWIHRFGRKLRDLRLHALRYLRRQLRSLLEKNLRLLSGDRH